MSGDDGLKLDSKGELSFRRDIRPKDTKMRLGQPGQLYQEENTSHVKLNL